MKIRSDSPITESDLKDYLRSEDDFDFELDVCRRARGCGLSLRHAGTYNDPVTGKVRQFDVRLDANIGNHRISLAVECKRLKRSFPLLVSCVPRPEEEAYHEFLRTASEQGTWDRTFAKIARVSGPRSIYPPGEPVAKQMRQVGRNDNGLVKGDEVFDKWMQALASSAELVEAAFRDLRPLKVPPSYRAILPILIVSDDTLWEVDYSVDGCIEREPRMISEVTFFLGRKYSYDTGLAPGSLLPTFVVSHLHIMTLTAASTFLEAVSKAGPFWESIFSE